MTKRSIATAVALAVLGLPLAGCLLPADDGDTGDAGAPPVSAEASTAAPKPSGTGTSLEGAFTHQTMDDYVNAVLPMIEQWVDATWPGMPLPQVVYVPSGAAGREGCQDADGRFGTYTAESYEYCPPDNRVYVGQDALWEFYTKTGDAGPAVGLAHEFGHHIQTELRIPPARTAEQSVQIEDQADCLAGAWTKYTDEQGWLEYPDDIEDIEALFPLIGSAEGAERDHGTVNERRAAFEEGFSGGTRACGV